MINFSEKYGKWVLITGASSGIGEEFARKFSELGLNVILIARRFDRLLKLKNELESKFQNIVLPIEVDLSENNFYEKIENQINDKEIGILINNAGFGYRKDFIESNIDDNVKMVKVNCIAPVILTHKILPKMIERKKGALIFLGSIVAFQPTPTTAVYAATKAFDAYLGDALWYELKKHNIDVVTVNPGGTETEFHLVAKSTMGPFPRTSRNVVDTTLKALGKKPSVVDGFYNKILAVSSRLISRKLTITLAGKISESLYQSK
ncbi:MAG: SDR family oxidoreductase [Melioribacteraceae bacterium]|nr:SDR family oxidoreductase [Melioribacteraceae bacterium]